MTGDYATGATTEVNDKNPSFSILFKAETIIAWVVPIIGGLTQTKNLEVYLVDNKN